MAISIADVLQMAVLKKASDIHLVINKPPMVRVRGEIVPLEGFPVIQQGEAQQLIYSILFDAQRRKFEEHQELDCSFTLPNVARFRVNVLMGRLGIEAVLRVINAQIKSPKELGFTPVMESFSKLSKGLILVTGPTGSGKTTTLATMIDLINQNRRDHILTIEDPIEFVFEPKNCIIRQREVGTSTQSFANALRAGMREDPDVILVGEMRDLETIQLALTASETGHLVFATLHTSDAPQTIDRIIDVFPPHQQTQVRVQLSTSLKAVVCQTLLPTADGMGRVAAREIMLVTQAISTLIREGKNHQIYNAMDTGAKFGMVSLDRSLEDLVRARQVKLEDAMAKARDPEKVRNSVMGVAY